jgi:hypothetical protein
MYHYQAVRWQTGSVPLHAALLYERSLSKRCHLGVVNAALYPLHRIMFLVFGLLSCLDGFYKREETLS